MTTRSGVSSGVEVVRDGLSTRNSASEAFFSREADRLADAARALADRFSRGGRLLALGRAQYGTDAQHVEVEFVHPVLVGKRALPAVDVSSALPDSLLTLVRADDAVMVLGPPEGDPVLAPLLEQAAARGALTLGLPCRVADYAFDTGCADPFVHQEILEILYHTLWESVHVFGEPRGAATDGGPAAFLYPFMRAGVESAATASAVAASVRSKVNEDSALRTSVGRDQADAIWAAALAIHRRVSDGGKLILFGNGGSATDANDWALDCVSSPKGGPRIPAISLASGTACLSAVANDVGTREMFLRPLIAHASSRDVAIGISTSGGSHNVIAALDEAGRRGLLTVALLGHDGGEALRRGVAAHAIAVGSASIPRIQEVQASVYHVILDLLAELAGQVEWRAPSSA
jgi:D-sedoheptulose 7-phosphate isomerase